MIPCEGNRLALEQGDEEYSHEPDEAQPAYDVDTISEAPLAKDPAVQKED